MEDRGWDQSGQGYHIRSIRNGELRGRADNTNIDIMALAGIDIQRHIHTQGAVWSIYHTRRTWTQGAVWSIYHTRRTWTCNMSSLVIMPSCSTITVLRPQCMT